ncbi:aldo/keto reductase [Candidatus Kaiserbacteria bacterium]|nr:aldo/keto reductase [Candidatus Kaiserbacteria bacterium]
MNKSRLVLGTAQLGMEYGVANTRGAPSKDEAFAILDAAREATINTFDTAPAYGVAEDILGEWMRERAVADSSYVVTKLKGDDPATVKNDMKSSLSRLRLERLDGCLLHAPENMYDANVMNSLHEAKKAGLTSHIGVSVYDETDALHALELGMDYIQVPYNAFDQRLDNTDFFDQAKKKRVTVFARSPFLQGLLLMEPERLPRHLAHARVYLEQFIDIAAKYGLSQLEAALGFAYYHSRADHIVFGVERVEQLEEILAALKKTPHKVAPWVKEMAITFRTIDTMITDPRSWKTA